MLFPVMGALGVGGGGVEGMLNGGEAPDGGRSPQHCQEAGPGCYIFITTPTPHLVGTMVWTGARVKKQKF